MGDRADRRERDERLAQALRANLRRRKAQARDRRDQAEGEDSGQGDSTSGDQDSPDTSTEE